MPQIDRAHFWQTVRLFGACGLAFVGAVVMRSPETYWALITAIIVTQPMLADTFTAGRDRIVGTLIGAAVGFVVLELTRQGAPKLPLFWVALALLSLLVALYPYLRLSAVTLVIVVLVPGAAQDAPFARPFDRVAEILLGTIAAVIAAAIVRPRLWRRGDAAAAALEREKGQVAE